MSRSGVLRTLLLAAALSLSYVSDLPAHPGRGEFRPNELVCEMLPGYDIEAINTDYGTSVQGHQAQTDCYLLNVPSGQNAESLAVVIAARPEVLYCGLNHYVDSPEGLQRSQPFLDVEGTGDYESQAAAVTLDLASVRPISTGSGTSIALIDGGVNFFHPLFDSAVLISVYDYVDGDSLAFDEPGGVSSGHGTFVAGVLHLVAPDAAIYAYRVLDTTGRGNGYDVASAMLHAVDLGCRALNLSLGMIGTDDAMDEALRYAHDRKVLVIAAAGNDSTDDDALFPFPASRANCVAVAALDSVHIKADFSNYGPKIGFSAPGTRIYGPYLDSSYAWWDGTSFAAPFVTGTAALGWAMDTSLTRGQMDTLMALTATRVDSINPGLEGLLGHGLVNPAEFARRYRLSLEGDVNLDGMVRASDVICLVNCVFKSAELPLLPESCDLNCDSILTSADIIYLISYIFLSGEAACKAI